MKDYQVIPLLHCTYLYLIYYIFMCPFITFIFQGECKFLGARTCFVHDCPLHTTIQHLEQCLANVSKYWLNDEVRDGLPVDVRRHIAALVNPPTDKDNRTHSKNIKMRIAALPHPHTSLVLNAGKCMPLTC